MSFNNIKGNSTVMTDEGNVLVNPTDEEIINANPAFKSLKDKTQNITATENDTTFAGNIVVGDAINAGDNNITALKGWYIQYMDISGINSDTLVFYIGINQLTFEEGKVATEPSIDSTIESGYAVGDTISFVDDFHALNCAVITGIDHNKITVGSLGEMIKRKLTQASANNGWVDNGGNAQNDYSLCVFAKPTINEGVIINDNGYAFGRNNLPIGGESMAHGSTNISMGEYSTTQGVGLTSEGYAQTVVGAFNTIEPDTDNQYGSKNVFVVGNGGNLSNKSTAFTVKWSGDATCKNNFQAGGEVSSASMTTNTLSLNGQDVGDKLTSLQNNVDTLNNKTQKITSDGTSTTISGNLDISNGDIVADSVISAGEVSGSDGVFSGDVSVGGTSVKEAFENIHQEKESRGTYYINGGTITSAAFALSAPFTYFITYKAGFVGNLFAKGNTSLTVAANGTLTLTDGTNTATATMDATKDHLIAVEVLTTSASLIIDGIATTPTTFAFVDTASSGIVIGGTTTDGKLARPILFNFGISETNAPYTFADYQSGKALSPYLTNPIAKVEDPNLGASTDGGWDITANPTSTITKGKWTANSGKYISYLKNRTIGSAETAAGIEYAVDLCSTITILNGGGGLFYNDNALTMYNTGKAVIRVKFKYLKITAVGGTSLYTGLTIAQTSGANDAIIHLNNGSVSDHNWHEYNQILTANTNKASNANGSRIGLSAGGLASGETGASWSIADFHFEILGALFAPADFVITTGTTRNIPDLSGQGKDATLSGQPATVKTDNDIKVAKLKEYFTANT